MSLLIEDQGPLGLLLDTLVSLGMRVVSGAFSETPQRTHFWNNRKLDSLDVDHSMTVHISGDPEACPRGIIRFHLPICGGWKKYIVIAPQVSVTQGWYVGWSCVDVCGISKVRLRGRVRLLIGPGDFEVFGFDYFGHQIPLQEVGRGSIGSGGKYCKDVLL